MSTVETVQSEFVLRFISLPVVSSAFEVAANTYVRVKQVNPILEYALGNVEKSTIYANEKTKPFVKHFGKQISFADGLACNGLNKLVERVPMIAEPTEVILENTVAMYDSAVKIGVIQYKKVKNFASEKVNSAKEFSLNTASSLNNSAYGKLVHESLNSALTYTETYVDHLLIPLDEEKCEAGEPQEIVARLAGLGSKIQRRVYRHSLSKAKVLKQFAEDSLIRYNPNIMDNMNVAISNAQTNANWVWEQLNLEPEPTEDSTLSQRVLTTARYATKNAVSVFDTAKTTVQGIQIRVNDGLTIIHSLNKYYINLSNVQSQELVTIVLNLKDSLQLVTRVNLIVHDITQTSTIQWLVRNLFRNENSEISSNQSDALL